MNSRILIAAALVVALGGLHVPAAAQAPAPTPTTPPGAQPGEQPGAQPGARATQRPGAAPRQAPTTTGQPSAMPQMTFEEIVGDVTTTQPISPLALGVGAIAGVLLFNLVAPAVVPAAMVGVAPAAGTYVAESALAASRIYTVTSAVVGAWVGQWIYTTVAR